MKKLKQEQQLKQENKVTKTAILLGVLCLILVAIRVAVANQLVEKTAEMGRLNARIVALTSENSLLSYQLENMSSLTSISQKAETVGFLPPQKVKFISLPPVTAFAK